jgi:hypothetical protein
LAVVVIVVLVAAAMWKPWEGAPSAAGVTPATVPTGAGGVLPAITSGPGGTAVPAPTRRPTPLTFAGLGLAIAGTFDRHPAWGVAVAYVSHTQFVNATQRGSRTVTPAVKWHSIEPGTGVPGPTLDHPDVTSVAFALTWPIGVRPVTIWLVSYAPPRPVPSIGPSPGPQTERPIPPQKPIAAWFRVRADEDQGPGLTSGAFYLPSPAPPGAAADWPGHGWPPGRYGFQADLEGGGGVTLPFTIGGSSGS